MNAFLNQVVIALSGRAWVRAEVAQATAGELLRWADAIEARASDASYTQPEEVTIALLSEARLLRSRAAELRGKS